MGAGPYAGQPIVYRAFDTEGRLLWIGHSGNGLYRVLDRYESWWAEVTTIRVEHHADVWSARRAEREAIRSERPYWNQMCMVPTKEDLGRWGAAIRNGRQARGWRQADLAQRLGTTGASVCRWERAEIKPPLSKRRELARLLEQPLEELFTISRIEVA